MWKKLGAAFKRKYWGTIQSSRHTNGPLTWEDQNEEDPGCKSCTAALFTIAKPWKQPKCPSTDEWIKKMWYLYTMEYYSATKKNEIIISTATWMDLDYHTKWSKTEKDKYHITYMWNLKKMIQMNLFTNRNRVTDVENKLMVTRGKGEEG